MFGTSRSVPVEVVRDFDDLAITFEELEQLLRKEESETERQLFQDKLVGRGMSNAQSNLRLFDAPDGYEPEVTLYRDTAAWCPYCEKVWLLLEEKRIPYKVEKVPLRCYGEKPRSFFQVSPRGGLPAAIVKGRCLTESNDIMFLLESEFRTYKKLMPERSDPLFDRAESLLRLERQVFSVWFSWLTSSEGETGIKRMDSLLKVVDKELSETAGPYFLGSDISMVDIMFTPFLERMAASLPYFKGFESRNESKYPFLYRWYVAMDGRPAYQGIKSDYYTHCHDLPPQIGNCRSLPAALPFARKIDGEDWSVHKSLNDIFEPMIPFDENIAKREAVRNVVQNFKAIVRFTTRPLGVRRGNGADAPLADPDLLPNDSMTVVMDSILRHVLHLILDPSISSSKTISIPMELKPYIRDCLLYLRDRIGVPRDMSVHAAKQLRAHINWFIELYIS